MRVVALLTVRNEELYVARCLENLYVQGIETCLIDNGSTDRTVEIAETFRDRGVFRIEYLPFNGCFELERILQNEERLSREIDADWFIHYDADEIRQACNPYTTLLEGFEDADRQGYNAINFDEFVFLPTSEDESFEGKDYVAEMRYYYFFNRLGSYHRLNAWKKTDEINLYSRGGHRVEFPGQKIFPHNFILRHYIALSKQHAVSKYMNRVFSATHIARQGSLERVEFKPENCILPSKSTLKQISDKNEWDKSEPRQCHQFLNQHSPGTPPSTKLHIYAQRVTQALSQPETDTTLPPMPIIVGAPRSGTTLLRLMLDKHPDLAIPNETYFIQRLFEVEKEGDQSRETLYQTIINSWTWDSFQLDFNELRQQLNQISPFTLTEGIRCFYKMYASRFKKTRWGDKTPRYALFLAEIQNILPEAHFIHIIRDGRDTALSMQGMWWGPGDEPEQQAIYWLSHVRPARQQGQVCRHYMEVFYEDLIQNTTETLKRICDFIQLPYNPAMEDYHQSASERLDELIDAVHPSRQEFVPKEQWQAIFSATSRPPDRSKVGRWQKEMDQEYRRTYEKVAGMLLRDLGYETGEISPSPSEANHLPQKAKSLRVVALLTVRNEERYLAHCIEHLHHQGIEVCVVDHDSTDRTLEIAQSYLGRGVFKIESLPFTGCFDLQAVLLNEERLAHEIDADWFIHHDADEIRQAPAPYKTLLEAIEDVDRQGYNAIDFNEFIFIPTSEGETFEGKDYVQEMQYYLYAPHPFSRINAWKKTASVDLHTYDGHQAVFPERNLFPTHFILRHYIFLSKIHSIIKYVGRIYPKYQLITGNPKKRAGFSPKKLNLPSKEQLKQVDQTGDWDTSDPWHSLNFLGQETVPAWKFNYIEEVAQNYAKYECTIPPSVQEIPLPMPFVVGAPRSGTTLLRLMLDSHPDLAIAPETHCVPRLLNLKNKDQARLREIFYQKLIDCQKWSDFHLSADEVYRQLLEIQPFSTIEGIRRFYQLYAARFQKKRIGDKTPAYSLQMYEIQSRLPEAHFIHIIRDGRDVALSIKDLWFDPGKNMTERAADWVWRVRESRQQAQICQNYLEVRYEELVTNPQKVLREICDFIRLPYSSEMEQYYERTASRLDEFDELPSPDGTSLVLKEQRLKIHQLTLHPPDASRIGRWRHEMSQAEREEYEALAGFMLRDLGYEVMSSSPTTTTHHSQTLELPRLQQIQADLNRSHLRLKQIKASLSA